MTVRSLEGRSVKTPLQACMTETARLTGREHGRAHQASARICELGRRLGYNDAKAKMLVGQSAGNLAGLERRLGNELDERPHTPSVQNSTGGRGRQEVKDVRHKNEAPNTLAEPLRKH